MDDTENLMRFVHAIEAAQAVRGRFMSDNGLKLGDNGVMSGPDGDLDHEAVQKIAGFMTMADDAAHEMAMEGKYPTEHTLRSELKYKQQLKQLQDDLASAKTEHAKEAIQRYIEKWQSEREQREAMNGKNEAIEELKRLAEQALQRGDSDASNAYLEAANMMATDVNPEALTGANEGQEIDQNT